jgi:hypothetical protein
MSKVKQILWAAALAPLAAMLSHGSAHAQEAIYDGLTFAQFKSILSATNLTLEERTTQKGNPYLIISVTGATAPFIGTMISCPDDRTQPCDGFIYFYIDNKRIMNAAAMAQFNREFRFLKAIPALSDATRPVIQNENYAIGGIAGGNVRAAGANYTAGLEAYHASGTIAAGGSITSVAFTTSMKAEQYFAELAARAAGKPMQAVGPIDEALIDTFAADRR